MMNQHNNAAATPPSSAASQAAAEAADPSNSNARTSTTAIGPEKDAVAVPTNSATSSSSSASSLARRHHDVSLFDPSDDDDEVEEAYNEQEQHGNTALTNTIVTTATAATRRTTSTNDTDERSSALAATTTSAAAAMDALYGAPATEAAVPHHPATATATMPHTTTVTTAPATTGTNTTAIRRWDQFVRSGTHLQTLFVEALTEAVAASSSQKRPRLGTKTKEDPETAQETDSPNTTNDDNARGGVTRGGVTRVADFTVELAREKTALVRQLQRQLKDAQSQSEAMKAANASLREETASSQARLDRTVEALRLAGRNAAAARANADAAEATATTLSQTLQALQTVIAETKRASQLLHHEQESVTAKAALVETKLLQKQGDLARANQELEQLRHSNADMERSQRTWSDERHRLEHLVKQHQAEVAEAKRAALEHLALEDARKQRADKVALELHQAQTLLTLATAGQAAAEQTQVVLKESLTSLQQSHTELHQSMQTQQEASRNDQQRLLETVHKLERDTQRLRIAAETSNEEIQRLRLDKRTAEQQIAHLQKQLNSSSRSSTEVQQTHSSDPITSSSSTEVTMISPPIHSATPTTHLSFHLPPLTVAKQQAPLSASTAPTIISSVTDKENEGVSNGVLCCLCFKHTSGMMKNCQCGDGSCRKRAHWNCVKGSGAPGPSVSHPGTPAPPLPVVLCGRGAVRRDRMSSLSSTNHNQKTPSSSVAVNGASTRDA